MNAHVIVEDGNDGTHVLARENKTVGRFRGINVSLAAGGTIATIDIKVYGGSDATAPFLRSFSYQVAANGKDTLGEVLDLDNSISTGRGLYVEVVVANAVAGSLNGIIYFTPEYS